MQLNCRGHSTAHGHGSDFMVCQYITNRESFVANWHNSARTKAAVVYLLGGGITYRFRSIRNRVIISHNTAADVDLLGIVYSVTTAIETKAANNVRRRLIETNSSATQPAEAEVPQLA